MRCFIHRQYIDVITSTRYLIIDYSYGIIVPISDEFMLLPYNHSFTLTQSQNPIPNEFLFSLFRPVNSSSILGSHVPPPLVLVAVWINIHTPAVQNSLSPISYLKAKVCSCPKSRLKLEGLLTLKISQR
jgi:hypothetical protein